MPERSIAPPLFAPAEIILESPAEITLQNGSPLYIINAGTQDVSKLELIFDAGSSFHKHPLAAYFTNELLDEGTTLKKSSEIAELFDFYGAYLQTECTADYASITLFTLNKFLDETVALLVEILNDPVFPEAELNTGISQEKQRLAVNLEKVDFLARKHFNHMLYGNHIYGYFPDIQHYDTVSSDVLRSFYETNYISGLKAIILAGKSDDQERNTVIAHLNNLALGIKTDKTSLYTLDNYHPRKKYIEKPGAVQNAIRIGKRLFNRTHADFPKMTVVNTILGGYFGSRLMTNIREDKGYTYGIGSGLASLSDDGYFYITTEVGSDVCDAALKEIYSEVAQLQEKLVPDEELSLVKNYLYGSFQRSVDGPFAISERFKSVLLSGLNYDYFIRYLDTLKNITPGEVLMMAQKHLLPSDFSQVTVGKI
jgi:zinc protease